jgi:hypothetical protein
MNLNETGKFAPLRRLHPAAAASLRLARRAVRFLGKAVLACLVIALAGSTLTRCLGLNDPPATLAEARQLAFRVILKNTGIRFDIPVTYDYSGFVRKQRQWLRPSRDEVHGAKRREVDYIVITALLPDMEPYTEENAAEFEKPGWGRKVRVSMTHMPRANWPYYFEHFAHRLERLPDFPEVPRMLHYRDLYLKNEVFLSHDHAVKDLIRIICDAQVPPPPFPNCKVATLYLNRFYFEYSFGRPYLPQWREIDRKLKALYDQFAQAATHYP